MSAVDSDQGDDVAGFGEKLLAVIDEGRRVSTYKLALLLALIDSCAAAVSADGRGPDSVGTRDIAQRVAALYWPQLRTYQASAERALVVRQITSNQSVILNSMTQLKETAGDRVPFHRLALLLPEAYEEALDRVEETLVRYPIRLLQVVGGLDQQFIYEVALSEKATRRQIGSNDRLRLRPGAADHLLRLAPLVRPLIELHWTRFVAETNQLQVDEDRLRAHLFGADRRALPTVLRDGLVDIQQARCFYCNSALSERSVEIDHFVPWARYPNDAVENLVAAHGECNNNKRDRIAATSFLEAWTERILERGSEVALLADQTSWEGNRAVSVGLVRTVYSRMPADTPLWSGVNTSAPANREAIRRALELLPRA